MIQIISIIFRIKITAFCIFPVQLFNDQVGWWWAFPQIALPLQSLTRCVEHVPFAYSLYATNVLLC